MLTMTADRILRDTTDGVITIDTNGNITLINRQASLILGCEQSDVGRSYMDCFFMGESSNETFHDFVLAAIYDKTQTHHGKVAFQTDHGDLTLEVRSFFLREEETEAVMGVAVTFADVTELEQANRKVQDSSLIISVLFCGICAYLLFWAFGVYVDLPISTQGYSLVINLTALGMFSIIQKQTSFTMRDMGLAMPDMRKVMLPSAVLTLIGIGFLVGLKLVIMQIYPQFFPEGAPFLDFSVWTFADTIYPLTVVLQEFLARGVIQNCMMRILVGKHAKGMALVISSLIFAVLHVSYGFPMMFGAALLLGGLGALYNRHGCIWGVAILHYFLGEAATFLRYII